MSWRRQNAVSLLALVILVALNTLLPAPEATPKPSRAVVAANAR
jgi:hypothetical protein